MQPDGTGVYSEGSQREVLRKAREQERYGSGIHVAPFLSVNLDAIVARVPNRMTVTFMGCFHVRKPKLCRNNVCLFCQVWIMLQI
jgi:hypothetical protein